MAITFDGPTKRINLSLGTTSLDIVDLWSRWVDWVLLSDNSKFPTAFSQVGGNEIDVASGTYIPIYIFMQNGWRIKPQEANHTLNVTNGILLVEGGGDPFVNTTGSFIIRINYSQPVQAITVSVDGGGSSGGATPAEITQYMDVNSIMLQQIYTDTHVNIPEQIENIEVSGGGGGATAQEIRIEMDTNSTKLTSILEDTNTTIPTLLNNLNVDVDAPTVQEIDNQLSEVHGPGSWEGGAGTGNLPGIPINHTSLNTSGTTMYYKSSSGKGIGDASVKIYYAHQYDENIINAIYATVTKKPDGSWINPVYLAAGVEYVIEFRRSGYKTVTTRVIPTIPEN